MNSDSKPLGLKDERAQYHTRWEAVASFKAKEYAAMTDARAWQIICSLRPFGPVERDPFNGMGLVEQQAIFHRRRRS